MMESVFGLDCLARHPAESAAVLTSSGVVTHGELRQRISVQGGEFARLGITRGDRVLTWLPNGTDAIVAAFAIAEVGAVAVPVHAEESADRVAALAEQIDARACVTDRRELTVAVVPTVCNPSRSIASPPQQPLPQSDPQQTAFIRFSSGSSGAPKAITITHGQVAHMARTLATTFGIDAAHRELVLAPVAFSGAWQRVAATLTAGGAVAFAGTPLTVSGMLDDIDEFGITGFFTTPPMLRMLLAAEPDRVRQCLARCRTIEVGSASVAPDELLQLTALTGARVFFHYGLTECSRATVLDVRRYADKRHTVGRPLDGVKVAFSAPDGGIDATLNDGEICVKGPQLTPGYWQDDVLNRDRFVDGWLRTGDLGARDADGFILYHGRRDDLINCGGVSFFPGDVEQQLGRVEGAVAYVIAGVPDARAVLGQVPWAFVQPAPGTRFSARRFMRYAKAHLPPARVPRRVVIVDELPLTASGKPDRRRTVERHTAGDAVRG